MPCPISSIIANELRSAGVRQPKAIIAINRENGDILSGQVSDLKGYEYCILKFGIHERNTAEMEMTYYDMATKAGIRRAEKIIHEVSEAIGGFRPLALQHGVQDRWIAAVEDTLKRNLEAWNLANSYLIDSYTDAQGCVIENIRIEQQFKGNYHLFATIDGRKRKFVIRKKTIEHEEISRIGISHLSVDYLKELVSKFMSYKSPSVPNILYICPFVLIRIKIPKYEEYTHPFDNLPAGMYVRFRVRAVRRARKMGL